MNEDAKTGTLGQILWIESERNAYLNKIANMDKKLQELRAEYRSPNPQRLPSDFIVFDISAMSREQKINIINSLLGSVSKKEWEEIKQQTDTEFQELFKGIRKEKQFKKEEAHK